MYRAARGGVELHHKGTWLGITDRIEGFMEVRTVDLAKDDIVLLFTDGVTEGKNAAGEMFGQEKLCESFARNARLPVERTLQKMMEEVAQFQCQQEDDMTLILLKKTARRRGAGVTVDSRRQERTRLIYHLRVFDARRGGCSASWWTSPPRGWRSLGRRRCPWAGSSPCAWTCRAISWRTGT